MKLKFSKKKVDKKYLSYFVIFLFILFISLSFILMNRKYLIIESIIKNINSSINSFFIDNSYSVSKFSSNINSSKIKYLEKENNDLRDLIKMKKDNNNLVITKIINHRYINLFNKAEISNGSKDNIKIGSPVISQDGLVGFVSKTSKKVSEINLLTNVNDNNMISVFIRSRLGAVSGVLSKYDPKTGHFVITKVLEKEKVLVGDDVVLSNYDNELYKGIYVGKVASIKPSNYGLTRTITVESSVNFNDLLFLCVVTKK